jgi:glycosyltransferase involved in cell wall biosynthesis
MIMPKVSIIIPTYNRANFIGETIQSILNQTFQDFEIIVVDDGSTDNTKKIIDGFIKQSEKIKYLYQNHCGRPSIPRNYGFKISTGKYLAFLDSDDLWLPKKLEKQINVLEKNINVGFVDCKNIIINEFGSEIKGSYKFPIYNGDVFRELLKSNIILTPGSVIIKRDVIEKIGNFDESLLSLDDWDLWIRISKYYGFAYINEPLFKYRVHINNVTATLPQRNAEEQIIYIFEKHKNDYKDAQPDYYYKGLRETGSFYCKTNKADIGRKYFLTAIKTNKKDFRNYIHYLLSIFGGNFYNFSFKTIKTIFSIFRKKIIYQPNDLRGIIYKDVLNIKV